MKTTRILIIAFIAIVALSCSKSADTVTPATASAAELKTIVAGSSWKVSYFTERGYDKTGDYSSYLFDFNSAGSLIAANTGNTFTGTWSLTQSNTKPDDSGHHSAPENKMIIVVSGNKQMEDLSKKWKITRLTAAEMWLTDDNPASAEEVRFIKVTSR